MRRHGLNRALPASTNHRSRKRLSAAMWKIAQFIWTIAHYVGDFRRAVAIRSRYSALKD
jgi:hypothetical protein